MNTNNYKLSEQQFSTTDVQQSRAHSYTLRFQKSKQMRNNNSSHNSQTHHQNILIKDSELLSYLPYFKQKAAVVIQRFWRQRMRNRRRFYQGLYEELLYDNQATECMINAAKIRINNMQRLDKIQIDKYTNQSRLKAKSLAKQCVTLAFKLQKQMLTQSQLNNLLNQRALVQERILKLKQNKLELQKELITKSNQTQQMILCQIKQANAQLLKVVSEKNSIKQKLRQKQIQRCPSINLISNTNTSINIKTNTNTNTNTNTKQNIS